MKPLKVLNLYAGIGGNRKLWDDVEVTAVELDPQIAEIYKSYFPDDNVIVGDAHQYLLDHYKEFEFIWASPPCPTHSKMQRTFVDSDAKQNANRKAVYPDMKLYQEIILLSQFFDGKYCVENVKPYYKLLIPAQEIDRHLYWCNFKIGDFKPKKLNRSFIKADINSLQKLHDFDLSEYSKIDKAKTLRNCVDSETGLYILNCARNIINKSNVNQLDLF